MSRTLIRVFDLSKRYVLSHKANDVKAGQVTLRDEIVSFFTNAVRKRTGEMFGKKDSFWALKDINFEIKEGEAVGFVGHNGAGKSTLLKLLSRVTEPTTGEIEINGRMSSLLEVATGFHPELTGRENIYLKGAILGMRHAEIKQRFDEIVDFAEVARFLDTPVKRYSSGMYVKLGFSVAAHLDPDILIVDEVLAVGDAHFRRKCVEKMQKIMATEGRTILFVSHNMALIRSLCERVIALEKGQIVDDGPTQEVISRYTKRMEEKTTQNVADRTDRQGEGKVRLIGAETFCPGENGLKLPLMTGQPAKFVFRLSQMIPGITCHAFFVDKSEVIVTNFDSSTATDRDSYDGQMENCVFCEVDELPLFHGTYHVEFHIYYGGKLQDCIQNAFAFDVEHGSYRGRPMATQDWVGAVQMEHRWTFPKA